MLHLDLPTPDEIRALAEHRAPASVTIVMPTTPVTQDAQADRIRLSNLAREALDQLEGVELPRGALAELEAGLADVVDDDAFWRFQARSLVVLATPERVLAWRLANRLTEGVAVSDRFSLTPLLRALAFPHHALALVLSQSGVRLIEVMGDRPAGEVRVPGMPRDAATVAGKSTLHDRSHKGRLHGSEGQKVRLAAYARRVDEALHPILAHGGLPLVLVAVEPVRSIFRAVCRHPLLLEGVPEGVTEQSGDADVAAAARAVLDGHYAAEVAELRALYARRAGERRATAKIMDAARAATFGGIQTLMVDLDASIPGRLGEEDGAVTYADAPGPDSYDLVDEIAARALRTGARVISVRAGDLPEEAPVAAILRHPV